MSADSSVSQLGDSRPHVARDPAQPSEAVAEAGRKAAEDARRAIEAIKKKRPHVTEADALGAIRLAMEAGADLNARERVVAEILRHAPVPEAGDTRSVKLLIKAVRSSRARKA